MIRSKDKNTIVFARLTLESRCWKEYEYKRHLRQDTTLFSRSANVTIFATRYVLTELNYTNDICDKLQSK